MPEATQQTTTQNATAHSRRRVNISALCVVASACFAPAAVAIDSASVSKTVIGACASTFERLGVPANNAAGGENLIYTNVEGAVQTAPDGRIQFRGQLDDYGVVLGNNPTQSKPVTAALLGYYPNLAFTKEPSFDGLQAPGLPTGTIFLPGSVSRYDPANPPSTGELGTHGNTAVSSNGHKVVSLMLHGPGVDEWANGSLQPLGNGTTLWAFDGNNLNLILRSGAQAAGLPERTIAASALQPRCLVNAGFCLYQADTGMAADVTDRIAAAYLYNPQSQSSQLVIYNGMPTPGVAGTTIVFSRGTRTALLDNGAVVIVTYLEGAGLTFDSNEVVLLYSGGALSVLARSGTSVPTQPNLTMTSFGWGFLPKGDEFDVTPGTSISIRVSASNSTDSFGDQILTVDLSGTVAYSDYFNVRGQAPGFPVGVTLDAPLRNDATAAPIVTGAVSNPAAGYTATGCWFATADGLKLIAYTGQAAPGISGATVSAILLAQFEAKGPHGRRANVLAQIEGSGIAANSEEVFIAEEDGQLLLARNGLRTGKIPTPYTTTISTSEDRAALVQFKKDVHVDGVFTYVDPSGDTYTLVADDYSFNGLSDAHAALVFKQNGNIAKGDYDIANPRNGVVETYGYGYEQALYFQFPGASPRALIPLASPQVPASPTPTPTATPDPSPNPTPAPTPTVDESPTAFPARLTARVRAGRLIIPFTLSDADGLKTVRAAIKGRGSRRILQTWNAKAAPRFSTSIRLRILSRAPRMQAALTPLALTKPVLVQLSTQDGIRSYKIKIRPRR